MDSPEDLTGRLLCSMHAESINWALSSAAKLRRQQKPGCWRIVTCAMEHPAVLSVCESLRVGFCIICRFWLAFPSLSIYLPRFSKGVLTFPRGLSVASGLWRLIGSSSWTHDAGCSTGTLFAYLERFSQDEQGFELQLCPVTLYGLIDLEALRSLLTAQVRFLRWP